MKKVTKTTVQKDVEQVEFVECDMCGIKSRTANRAGSVRSEWDKQSHEVATTWVAIELGESYPECRSTKIMSCDLCPKCFQKHVVEHLESLGVSFREADNDW